ncbi:MULTISPECIES: DUF1553 domain-containing protein [unclassified Arcicella]|uniref:DUF1553 domain-containing protein n=1 Tax=unclassified Arcicella TaxID=2644986 RepID=UPI00285D4007|nr:MULTISPECIES: DUF1553 domain-containing protein [unclassified Arcicella]MDR6562131.1 hypothetical protein [Arcicella sp. BE51]MDR6812174.1 hypothetical protein [Arcicella sp. BE140]MDR6823486.1 hypothetical protein [Arcicella sp. BE139]
MIKYINYISLIVLSYCLWSCSNTVEIPKEVLAYDDKLPETVDYNLHIKPILSDRCFKCHGPDKNKIEAGLQLASFDGATLKLKSGAKAIDPSNIANSELVNRILSKNPDDVMPTPESHLSLSDEEKALLIKWIKQGAEYKEHWSLVKIENPEVPKVGKNFWSRWGLGEDEETNWIKNEIDNFSLAKMKEKGLKPSPKADKNTLLRRVYMDLTGLPPTPSDITAFINDQSTNAYEKVVDKLLKSQHYGEQQAVSWLDLARYADSNGYQDDALRTIYPYRDWVIKSFNENLPFDKFISYQLAGDLYPNPSKDMMVATAFNRNHSQSEEDGIVPDEYQVEYVADRTNTFGKAMLGLTMECCRCHDHKYDPISQKDYYSMFAFFNNINEHGQVPHKSSASPIITISKPEAEKKIKFIKERLSSINQSEENLKASINQRFENWLLKGSKTTLINPEKDLLIDVTFDANEKKREGNRIVFKNNANDSLALETYGDLEHPPLSIKGRKGLGVKLVGDSYLKIHETNNWWNIKKFNHRTIGNFERNQPFTISLWVGIIDPKFKGQIFNRNSGALSAFRGYECERLEDGRLAFRISNIWPDDAIDFETDYQLKPKQWTHITMTYDGLSKAEGLKIYINGNRIQGKILANHLSGSIIWEKNHEILKSYAASTNFSLGKRHTTINKGYAVDELKIFGRVLTSLEVQSIMSQKDLVRKTLQQNVSDIDNEQREALFEYYKTHIDPTSLQLATKSRKLIGEEVEILNKGVDIMVSRDRKYPRKSYILNRGVYDAHGEEVSPEIPLRLGKLPSDYPKNRLGLSQWLLSKENPLFARVMVNRLWQQYFGNGLVKTQEDFGNQGELPSHPELLDWLATAYREDNWNTKAFIKRMVMSATYQQSSKATKEQIEVDPDNKWLARGSSYRFSAEQVRDNALVASGLLVKKIGGESVYPYQPAGIWEALATRNVTNYVQQHGENLYRRSMYTIWKRTSPPPMMLNFDSPDRSLCTVRRQKTATPLQALVTLNDPSFVEAARVLAQRTIKKNSTFENRIQYFFQSIVSRNARPSEVSILKELFTTEYETFEKDSSKATLLVSVGEYPRDMTLNPVELATYTVIANTILNYDEAIVKR